MNDPRITNVLVVDRLSIVLSLNRPPSEDDKEAAITVVFRDTLNKNTYISVGGGDWEYMSSKGIRDNVYVGSFEKSDGTVIDGEYNATATGIGFGVNADTPIYRVISEIINSDKLFVGTKRLNVSSVSFASSQWTVFGTWQDTFADLTFDASESIYYTRSSHFIIESIWNGRVGQDSSNQTLNAGKKFSDYEMLSITVDWYGSYTYLIPTSAIGIRGFYASGRNISVRKISDNIWKTPTGNGGIVVLDIKGLKVE